MGKQTKEKTKGAQKQCPCKLHVATGEEAKEGPPGQQASPLRLHPPKLDDSCKTWDKETSQSFQSHSLVSTMIAWKWCSSAVELERTRQVTSRESVSHNILRKPRFHASLRPIHTARSSGSKLSAKPAEPQKPNGHFPSSLQAKPPKTALPGFFLELPSTY